MKKYILYSFFILFTVSAFSINNLLDINNESKYHSILGDSNKWYIAKFYEFLTTEVYTIDESLLIDSNKYYKINRFENLFICFVREDTTKKKIYLRLNDTENDIVLYDFSLNLDNEINIIGLNNNLTDTMSYGKYVVVNVDSISTLGGIRKKLELSRNNSPNITWIEGIGNINDFLTPYPTDSERELTCFYKNGIKVYFKKCSWCDNDECEITTDINSMINNESLIVYPIPFQNTINIEANKEKTLYVSLCNPIGVCVFKNLFENQTFININLSGLPDGIYILRIKGSKIFYNRVVQKK